MGTYPVRPCAPEETAEPSRCRVLRILEKGENQGEDYSV